MLSIQKLKSSFIYLLWLETKLFLKDGSSTLVGFIDWIGSCRGWSFLAPPLLKAVFCPSRGEGCSYAVSF